MIINIEDTKVLVAQSSQLNIVNKVASTKNNIFRRSLQIKDMAALISLTGCNEIGKG